MSENEVVSALCEYLSLKRYFFFRVNNTGLAMKTEEGFRYRKMSKYSISGVPDIILIKDGVFWGIEAKKKGGRQSENQVEFERRCKQAGGQYHLCTSIDDLQALGL
jgi:hypothetical protein